MNRQLTPNYPQGLQWLEQFIKLRCQQVFTLELDETPEEALNTPLDWLTGLEAEDSYPLFLQACTVAEQVIVFTALANQIYPQMWQAFGEAVEQLQLEEQDTRHFGLAQLSGTAHLQATFSTVSFLLGGISVQEQMEFWRVFEPNTLLRTSGVLEWPDDNTTFPALNAIPKLSQSFLHQLLTNQPYHPQYSPDFPATLLTTTKTWDDLLLGERTATLITQARKWVQHYDQVSAQTGAGKGYRLLMAGASGTGKTLTAALLGQEAGKPVYRIDISTIVDKYVGETSKKLRQIFELAEARDWILFFDEGDALFGKRTEGGQSSNERYANQEVSYLLYKLEEYQGMIFLATNQLQAIDVAFKRRFDSLITFDKPDLYARQQLWQHFFERPQWLQIDPIVIRDQWRELASKAEVSAAWIEKFYTYCVMQATAKGDTNISAEEMRQYLYWFGWEQGYFELSKVRGLFEKKVRA